RRWRGQLGVDVRAERHENTADSMVRWYAVAEERADRSVLEQLAAEGCGERENADDLLRRSAGPACAHAAVGGDVSRGEEQRRAHTLVRRSARAARVGGTPA